MASQQPTIYDLKIEIKPDNRVYPEGPKAEVGQGFLTMFGMLVADSLDVPFEKHGRHLLAGRAEVRRRPDHRWFAQHPGAVRPGPYHLRPDAWPADGRRLEPLGVPVSQLRTEDGHVIARDGRKLAYGELSREAAALPLAKAAMPKKASEFKIIGKPQNKYGIEKIVQGNYHVPDGPLQVERVPPSVVAMAATHGASVVSIDDSAAKAMKGVIAITHVPGMADYLIPEAVVVTAETFGIAKKAKNTLKIKWSAGPMDQLSDAQIDDLLNRIIDNMTSPGEGVEATFRWPYVPHAPMEENASCGRFTDGKYEGWGGAQVPADPPASARRDPGYQGRGCHLPRRAGRRCLRASPVPRPGHPRRPRFPSGSGSR